MPFLFSAADPETSGANRDFHLSAENLDTLFNVDILGVVASRLGHNFLCWRSVSWNLSSGQRGQNFHQDIWPWWDLFEASDQMHPIASKARTCSIWITPIESGPDNAGFAIVEDIPNSALDREMLRHEGCQSGCEEVAVQPLMTAGDAVLFDEFTLHGPGLRASSGPKVAFVLRFCPTNLVFRRGPTEALEFDLVGESWSRRKTRTVHQGRPRRRRPAWTRK